ncbi:MAG: DUF6465 family protein [Eubacterium sp.]|nr:DUF6465 family protein [Eubacterium sp.]
MARKCSVERAEKIAGGFAKAKKNIIIQYQGRERTEQHLLEQIRQDAARQGVPDDDIMELDVYVKPEEHSVFYVINKETEGKIEF